MTPEVAAHFTTYPPEVREYLHQVRQLIVDVAKEHQLGSVEETLKWGEPSYKVKGGSPVRFDWKPKQPSECALYFVCTTRLVETFREIYGDELVFDGKRAIRLSLAQPFPEGPLAHCIAMAHQYQSVKHLPILGA
ncbi:hypothetical protein BGP77_06150 [Saccharospirillum sp. MSK14-1]|uniref:DUF1801 domain-containing protein n=1 Tax=Saccharospirillum sp. MSK14-1 TaxID=1897632 RepID=UPI000D3D08B0|nr:DUF1801 domain-containing protein [Saccharospirillum sp. MSK14-1]PTY36864.1 hypothetical protein BGP77_06150 [Saccharospirillum sp. MSK14-1]